MRAGNNSSSQAALGNLAGQVGAAEHAYFSAGELFSQHLAHQQKGAGLNTLGGADQHAVGGQRWFDLLHNAAEISAWHSHENDSATADCRTDIVGSRHVLMERIAG